MKPRKYKTSDCSYMAKLFYDTVHKINAKDYSKEQLNVWATGNVDLLMWDKSFSEHNTVIVEENGIIVGFGDMDKSGYLDRLYVHFEYKNKGIATSIVNELENEALTNNVSTFTVHASITSKSFFEKCGYVVVCENTVERNGVKLNNFIMQKKI